MIVGLPRGPPGFVDGPNLYAYVKENPWSAFDPKGLDLAHLGQAWMKGDFSLQTLVGETGGNPLYAMIGMAPNDMGRLLQHGVETGQKIRGVHDGILKAGGTNAQAKTAATVMTLGVATGALPLAEAIDGNKIVATQDGGATTQQMSGGERALQGVAGAIQMGGVYAGVSSLRSGPTKGASGTIAEAEAVVEEASYRIGRPVPQEGGLDWALRNPQERIDLVVEKYGFNLKGKTVSFDESLGIGQFGKTAKADPMNFRIGQTALASEQETAATIAHELRHSRAYLGSGSNTEEAATASENALREFIQGKR